MRKVIAAYAVFFLMCIFPSITAQGLREAPTRIDSFGKPGCELLRNRLDYLAAKAAENPNSAGFVVLYPGHNVFENAAYERAIINNSAFRRFPDRLVQLIRSTRKNEIEFELWRGETAPPVPEVPFDYQLPGISTRTRFVDDSVEVLKFEGKLDYLGGSCVNEFSLPVLSKVLFANSYLSAEVVIFNKKSTEAGRLSRLILNDAVSANKIPTDRLKVFYGGKGKATEWSSSISAVEVWLVPTKKK